ncbi:MAG: O-antigen ligase family protein, partial [Pseudomonadota bacterium]|nr:O-antigen ligase family protein [Pseudomonadota bacterium]
MTAAEWGRTGPAAPAAGPADSRWNWSLVALGEYGAAGLVLLLMSGALLGPVFDPEQTGEVGWLRTLWLPVYALILLLVGLRMRSLRTIAVPALLAAPLLLLALVSSEWSILPEVTVRRAVALSFTTLFGLWLAARFSWREAVGLVAGVSLVLAVGSCLMALLAPEIGTHATIHAGAWRGLWYEKNALGGAMALGVLACACAARLTPEGGRVWLGGAALCAGLVVMSTSTTALLALVMIGVGFALIGGMRRGAASAVTTVWMALVAAGLAAGVFALAPDLIFQALGKDPSLTGRTEIWDAVLRRVQERPVLGYGFGAFWEDKGGPVGFVRNEVNWSAPTAHNGWLELLLSFGWTGVGLFALHLLVVAGAGLLSIPRGPEAYWVVIFLALFVLFSLSESTILQQNNLSWALYVMTGAKLLQRRAPEVVRKAAAPGRAAAPAAPLAYAAPLGRPAAVPAAASNTWSLVLAGIMLAIFSKTWMLVALGGGRVGWESPAWFQAVFLPAYGIGAVLALQRFP